MVHRFSVYQRLHGPRCFAATDAHDLEYADGSPEKGLRLARLPSGLLLSIPIVRAIYHYRQESEYIERWLSYSRPIMGSGSPSLPVNARSSFRHSSSVWPVDKPAGGTSSEVPKLEITLHVTTARLST